MLAMRDKLRIVVEAVFNKCGGGAVAREMAKAAECPDPAAAKWLLTKRMAGVKPDARNGPLARPRPGPGAVCRANAAKRRWDLY